MTKLLLVRSLVTRKVQSCGGCALGAVYKEENAAYGAALAQLAYDRLYVCECLARYEAID